jgi:superfamily II DNA/RNA helicase
LKESDNIQPNDDFLATAKGLEIFSLFEKRNQFSGVNYSDNMLYAAGLYYLASYPSSAWILSKLYPKSNYLNEIDLFIAGFLQRDLSGANSYILTLKRFLESGRPRLLNLLRRQITFRRENAFDEDIDEYFSYVLAEKILIKFINDNIWVDLLKVNDNPQHWKAYVIRNVQKKVPVWTFFPSQKLAIEKGVLSNTTCSLQMPTSAGKTSISELIIYNEFMRNADCHILYLAPYRALASELKQTLAVSLSELGITSKTIYGGNLPTIEERTAISEVNLLISTPEKFMAVEDIFPGISQSFTTIICDEGHLLDDDSRGLSYELLLSRLKIDDVAERRFIFVSAIIPNISTVNSWLGGSNDSLISSTYRPTELEYAFLKKMDKTNGYYLDVNPHKRRPQNYQLYKFLFEDELKIPITKKKSKKITSKKGISIAASIKATGSGTVALFAPHKRGYTGVEGLAEEALVQLNSKPEIGLQKHSPEKYLENLVEYFTIVFGAEYLLTRCAMMGVLFHHGDFPQNVREIVEDSLRENKIRLVICTNTLAEGVNLPIKTIVLHSTIRYNPYAVGNYSPLKIRDLKNLVGRAGRAGKETKGMVIIPHEDDFKRINELILDKNLEPVKGQLYNIIHLITDSLQRRRLPISPEILDSLGEQLQELLDNVDMALIDLLAEEVELDKLDGLVKELVTETLSFYQASNEEKDTLNNIFGIRVNKLRPIVARGDFAILKNSGTNIRLYEEIIEHFDFENEIWEEEFLPLNKKWLKYILDNGVFQLKRFDLSLEEFNDENNCNINRETVKKAITLWMKGNWYDSLSEELQLEIHQVLRLINSFIGFNVQSVVSSVIRLRELKNAFSLLPSQILNWASFLMHGVNSQLQLDLIELGLIERVAVLEVSKYLNDTGYEHQDYNFLKDYLLLNGVEIADSIQQNLPVISASKLSSFINRLQIKNIF